MPWLPAAKPFSIASKDFHNMPQTYHFSFISCVLIYAYTSATENYSPNPSRCKLHICYPLLGMHFLSLSCFNVTKPSCNMYNLKFQLWCETFPSVPGGSGFFLLGVPEYFLGKIPLIILCSDHLFLCSVSNVSFLRTVSVSLLYSQKLTWCLECSRCFIKVLYEHGLNEKGVLLFCGHLNLEVRKVLIRGVSGQTHIPCCVLNLHFPAYSLPLSNKTHEMPDWTGLPLGTKWKASFIGNEGEGGWGEF